MNNEVFHPVPSEVRPIATLAGNNGTIEQSNNDRSPLTVRPQTEYSGREGILFMAENGGAAEMGRPIPQTPAHIETSSSTSVVEQEHPQVFTKPIDTIYPGLQPFARDFIRKMEEKPLEQWELDDIGDEYKKLKDIKQVLSEESYLKNDGQIERIGEDSNPYNFLLSGEVRRRYESGQITSDQARNMFLGLLPPEPKTEEERRLARIRRELIGNQVIGGADPIAEADYAVPSLQNIVREINDEIGEVRARRAGRGEEVAPLDRRSIERQRDRIQALIDAHPGDANLAREGRRLLGTLRVFNEEARAAESAPGDRTGRTRGGRGERETTRTPVREVQTPSDDIITEPTLRNYRDVIRDFSSRSQSMDEAEIARIYTQFRDDLGSFDPPEMYSADDQIIFNQQKQLLLGTMAEILASKNPSDGETEHIGNELRQALEREDYQLVDALVNRMDIDGQSYARVIRNAIENVSGHEQMIEYLLEYGVERILSIADGSPQESYPQFNLYQQQNLDSVIQAARSYDERFSGEQRMFAYLTNLKARRYAMHELFRSMKDKKNYLGLVTSLLRKRGFDFVEKEIVGVADVQRLYEKVLGSNLSLKKGWLSDTDFAEADKQVEALLGQSANNIFQKEMRLPDGNRVTRQVRPWEIRRAALMGRSLNAASQRRLVYGVLGDLPENADELIKSREFEFIARSLAPMKLLPQRFFDWPVARRYLEFFLERKKKGNTYGIKRNGETIGLYGKSVDSTAILDLGIPDPKSNSWRSRLMFLKQEDYANVDDGHGHHIAVGHYLDTVKHHIEEHVKEQAHREHPNLTGLAFDQLIESAQQPYAARIKAEFNREIAGVIKDQRLFLGVLMRFPDLDIANKQAIWENVAKLLPSRTAAFLPQDTLNIVKQQYRISSDEIALEKWNQIKVKLFLAEERRVAKDGQNLRRGGSGIITNLEECLSASGLDTSDQAVVTRLQSLGHENAKAFAQMKFPFTAFLDDVPKTDWINLTDEDFDRLLVNDQGSFDEGYGHIMGIISNPGAKPDDVVKAFHEGFEGVKSPIGVKGAQEQLRPFISAYLDMVALRDSAKWFGSAMGLLRIPRSEVERFNLQSHITMDVEEVSNTLHHLAQAEVISDDPTEANEKGQTVLTEMLDEHKANRKARILQWARLILLLLGPVAGAEFLKLIVPGDYLK